MAESDAIIPVDLNSSTCGVVIGAQSGINLVEVSACKLATSPNVCTGIIDLEAGTANLPCVTLRNGDGTEYAVNMKQRGNSMNWEVTLVDYNYRKTNPSQTR